MAKTVKEMPDTRKSYPWKSWFDGRIWKLTQGEDFMVSMEVMRTQVYSNAQKYDVSVNTSVDGNDLYLRATQKHE